jgi:hypothetical protein
MIVVHRENTIASALFNISQRYDEYILFGSNYRFFLSSFTYNSLIKSTGIQLVIEVLYLVIMGIPQTLKAMRHYKM